MFRIYFTITLLFLFSIKVSTQDLHSQVAVQPLYSLKIADYIEKGNNAHIQVTNVRLSTRKFKLLPYDVEGKNEGYIAANVELQALAPIFMGVEETNPFTLNQLTSINDFPGDKDLILTGTSLNTLKDGDVLPKGVYNLHARSLQFQTGQIFSGTQSCVIINTALGDPPSTLMPQNGSEVMMPQPKTVNSHSSPSGFSSKTTNGPKLSSISGILNPLKWLSFLAALLGLSWFLPGIFSLFFPFLKSVKKLLPAYPGILRYSFSSNFALTMKVLKFPFWFATFLLLALGINAQSVSIAVAVPPPYPIHLDDYLTYQNQSIFTLTNTSDNPVQVKLIASVNSSFGNRSARVLPEFQPTRPIILGARETKVLNNNQLQSINSNLTSSHIETQGFDENQILRTGTLPEGNYQFCVRVHDYHTSEPLSSEFMGCAPVNLTHYDPPILITPQDGSYQLATQPQFLNFTWTPAGLPGKTRYELRLVDMTATGLFNPNDAFTGIVMPFFQKNNLLANSYQYGLSDLPLQLGHRYAVEVVAYDPTNSISFKNNGRSAVTTFVWKKQDILVLPDDPLPPGGIDMDPNINIQNQQQMQYAMQLCQENVNIPNPTPINGQGIIQVGDELNIGGHELELTEVNWSGNKLTGKGRIKNIWFRIPILVEFNDIKVNSDKVVVEGIVTARDDNNSPVKWINDLSNVQFGEQEIQNTINKLMGESNKRIVDWPNTKNIGVGVPVGIRRNIGGAQQIIAVVGMVFTPQGAGMNSVAQINIPASGQKMSLGGSGICFDPQGLKQEAFLFLADDYVVAPNKPVRMKLNKGNPNNQNVGTYITIEDAGFKNMQLDGVLQLDPNIAKPVNKQLSAVEAPFKIFVENFHNFIIENLSLTPFELVKLPGFEFTVTGISYDHSDLANPQGIVFPSQNYNTEGNLWKGFFFKNLSVKLPAKLQANTTISATNMLFDGKGFSGTISAPNVFGPDKGEMGSRKWPFSMQNLLIRFEANDLKEGKFDGKIRIPISKEDYYLNYMANISYVNELKYQFVIMPAQNVEFPAFIAKANLSPETHIVVEDMGNGFEASFHLFGSITLDTKLGGNLNGYDMSFQGITVQNLMVDKTGIKMGPGGGIQYNSPQKKLAGFDVSISGHAIGTNSFSFSIGVDFTGKENNVVGGKSGISILSKWENNMLKLDKFQLDHIYIKGDMSVVNVDGSVVFYYDDPIYGRGFKGNLAASIMLGEGNAGLSLGLFLQIGNKKNEDLKYFYFSGEVELPEPMGIPLSASMRLFGFKGGVYHHMKKQGDIYVPDANTKFGILAGVGIGLDSRHTFHAKLTLEASFGAAGITSLGFNGDAYIFTPFKPGFETYPMPQPLYVGVNMSFDFENKIFNLLGQLSVTYPLQLPLLEGNGEFQVYVAPDTWFIKAGTPQKRMTLEVLGGLFTAGHYVMAGHIPAQLPEPPQLVKDVLKVQNMFNQRNVGQLQNANSPGFAFGSLYQGGTGPLDWWIFYAEFAYAAGFDVMIYHQQTCQGINGWYALGQAYFAFTGEVGVQFQFRKNGPVRRVPLGSFQLGALAQMGLVNPFWFQGWVTGNGNVLGIFKGEFNIYVEYGEFCEGKPAFEPEGALDGIAFIRDMTPKDKEKSISVFAQPEMALNFSVNSNQVYMLEEQDEEGNRTKRYFRFPVKLMTIKEKESGKTLAAYNWPGNYPGEFKLNNDGTIFTYSSKDAFLGHTVYEWFIEIEILERINGQFVPAEGEEPFKKTFTFTTKAAPKTIEPENVAFCYPERNQRYYLQNDNARKGYIQVKVNAYQQLFDLTPANQFAVPDKVYVKFIPIGGGPTVTGEFLGYSNNRVHFSHPPLLNNRMYVAQFIKVHSPNSWLAASPPNNNKNPMINPDMKLAAYSTDLISQMTEMQKVFGELKLETREYEIFKYIFRTSHYNNLEQKVNSFQVGTVDNAGGNAPMASRTVTLKSLEGFDEADRMFLTFEWSLGFGFGGQGSGGGDNQGNNYGGQGVSNFKPNFYWNNYLDPYIYKGHNEILKPFAYPDVPNINPSVYMQLINPEPLLSEAEILAAANQKVGGMQGIQIQLAPSLKEIKFLLYGESIARYHHQSILMPRLLNASNPVIMACFQNKPQCNPQLKTLQLYHLGTPFKLLSSGTYQTLTGYNSYFIQGFTGDNRYDFLWNMPFGLGNH